jgi:SprT-like protein
VYNYIYKGNKGEDTMTNQSLTMYQLKMYADKFLKDTYGMDLIVPLELNGRLNTTCGRFISTRNRRDGSVRPKIVELNKTFVQNNEPVVVLDVLRHELVHYALFMQGKPNSDGHPVFENELKRLGIVSQKTIDQYQIASKKQVYACSDCSNTWKMARKLRNNGKYHKCQCGGSLIDKGRQLVMV